ncbi:MAG: hypothetical protein GY895_21160 [Phycisphaera sp.]|nr:hypothetical protein [Phycisphaera sp.]
MSERPASGATRTLDELLHQAWIGLTRAVVDGKHEWHLPVISTIDGAGRPTGRVVVLRHADVTGSSGPVLACHTDRRSRKVGEFGDGSADVAWTFYERRHKVQLRAVGRSVVHTDDAVADEAWARSSTSSRRCYLAPHGPSSTLDEWDPNLPTAWMKSVPDVKSSEAGRSNFSVIRTTVQELERLELHHDGHVRSRWRWNGADLSESEWLAP